MRVIYTAFFTTWGISAMTPDWLMPYTFQPLGVAALFAMLIFPSIFLWDEIETRWRDWND